jgi:methanogenic corrinoid protein MtbC1
LPTRLAQETSTDQLALRYVDLVLAGDRQGAIGVIAEAFEAGSDAVDLYEQVLEPAQREIGNLWHAGEIGVAQEHFSTSTTQRAMVVLAQRAQTALRQSAPASPESEAPVRTVVAAASAGNAHDMALRILTDIFELSGWRSVLLGPDVPATELVAGVELYESDLVLLSATLSVHLPAVRDTIGLLRDTQRERPSREVKVIVGGRAFDAADDLWSKVGADGFATSARQALDLADVLCPPSG